MTTSSISKYRMGKSLNMKKWRTATRPEMGVVAMANWYRGFMVLKGTVEDIRKCLLSEICCDDAESGVMSSVVNRSDRAGLCYFSIPDGCIGWFDGNRRINIKQKVIKCSAERWDARVELTIEITQTNGLFPEIIKRLSQGYNLTVIARVREYMANQQIEIVCDPYGYFKYELRDLDEWEQYLADVFGYPKGHEKRVALGCFDDLEDGAI